MTTWYTEPDDNVIPPHPFLSDDDGWCQACGRDLDAVIGAMTPIHHRPATYSAIPRPVYRVHEGGDTPTYQLCGACIMATVDPLATIGDIIDTIDGHCDGCDYHDPSTLTDRCDRCDDLRMGPVYAREERARTIGLGGLYRATPDDTSAHDVRHIGCRGSDLWACRRCAGGIV